MEYDIQVESIFLHQPGGVSAIVLYQNERLGPDHGRSACQAMMATRLPAVDLYSSLAWPLLHCCSAACSISPSALSILLQRTTTGSSNILNFGGTRLTNALQDSTKSQDSTSKTHKIQVTRLNKRKQDDLQSVTSLSLDTHALAARVA